ncbi:hypothetical protein GCM10018773_60120 [Streptomyces candidus]|nr:hypothetical protein GCM10018773_60120 [Streptomyces candidus]
MNGRIGHMATLVTDSFPEAEQHLAGVQGTVQESCLDAVGHALRSFEPPQVSVVDARPLRELAEAETPRISQLAQLVAPVV